MCDTSKNAETLLNQAKALIDRYDWRARHLGHNFNIFELLDRATDEEKGHSAFIAALLDPHGRHGQGSLFLTPFLEKLIIGKPEQPILNEESIHSVSVRTEVDTKKWGRIDILIEGSKNLVAIENKIYAQDQPDQLWRYQEYLKAASAGRNHRLVYLTLHGSEPSEGSLNSAENDSVSLATEEVTQLSYKKDIDAWLDECIQAAALLPRIRETLAQYQSLLRSLTGGGISRELTMEISSLIKNEKGLKAAEEIAEALPKIRTDIQLKFWKDLETELVSQNFSTDRSLPQAKYSDESINKYYGKKRLPEHGIGFALDKIQSGETPVLFVAVYNDLYFGLRLLRGDTWLEAGDQIFDEIRELLNFGGIKKDDWPGWLCWKYPASELRLHFHDFDETCRKLIDEGNRKIHIQRLAKEITNFAGNCEKTLKRK